MARSHASAAAAIVAGALLLAACSSAPSSDGQPSGSASPPAASSEPTLADGSASPNASDAVAPLPDDWANESTAPRPLEDPTAEASGDTTAAPATDTSTADTPTGEPSVQGTEPAAVPTTAPADASASASAQTDPPIMPPTTEPTPVGVEMTAPPQMVDENVTWAPVVITPAMAGQTIPLYVGQTATLSGFAPPNGQYNVTVVQEPAGVVDIQQATIRPEGTASNATITGMRAGTTILTVYDNDPAINKTAVTLMTFTLAIADLNAAPNSGEDVGTSGKPAPVGAVN